MKRFASIMAFFAFAAATAAFTVPVAAQPDTLGRNNDFYDDLALTDLPGPRTITIAGETADTGVLDLSSLTLRTVIRRDALLEGDATRFVGAYRYDGYSLFDVLRTIVPEKAAPAEFDRAIDLVVIVENTRGERVVISWGEIFYPVMPHRIIIAVKAAPIIPSVTKERWPLPPATRLVFGDDLLAERSIDEPSTVRIVSRSIGVPTRKGEGPIRAEGFNVRVGDEDKALITQIAPGTTHSSYRTVFYGRGKGFHGTKDFEGAQLRSVLAGMVPLDRRTLREGFLIAVATDGYRVAISCSELFNRSDNCEFLLIDRGEEPGGRFSIYPPMDFFSDRAVKALSEVRFLTIE